MGAVNDPLDGAGEAGPGDDREEPEGPLSELARSVGERRKRSGDGRIGELFAERSTEAVELESLWNDGDPAGEVEHGAAAEVVDEGEETFVVSKHTFCEQCPHLSPPPETRCTNEGTVIREFVDRDHVRVSSCPVVRERSAAEDGPVR